MSKQIEQVKEFHKVFEHPIGDIAKALSIKRGLQRHSYMKEELQEFHDAVEAEDLVEQADACIDIIYFALGTLVELGLADKYEDLFDEVQRSNMSKLCIDLPSAMETAESYLSHPENTNKELANIDRVGDYWKVSNPNTNKIVKSETYFKPNLKEIIDA